VDRSKTQWGVFVAAVRALGQRGRVTYRSRPTGYGLIKVIAADAVVGAAAAFALETVVIAPIVVKPQPQEKEAD